MPAPLTPALLIANAYGATGSTRLAAGILGISHVAVADYIKRNPDEASNAKKLQANKFLAVSEQALEHGATRVGEMKPMEAITAAAICADKYLALTGQAQPLVQVNIVSEALRDLQTSISDTDDLQNPSQVLDVKPVPSPASP